MPAIAFICPDGAEIPFAECLDRCRLENRCLSKRTLRMVAEQREWRGEPSTTQLLRVPGRLIWSLLRNTA